MSASLRERERQRQDYGHGVSRLDCSGPARRPVRLRTPFRSGWESRPCRSPTKGRTVDGLLAVATASACPQDESLEIGMRKRTSGPPSASLVDWYYWYYFIRACTTFFCILLMVFAAICNAGIIVLNSSQQTTFRAFGIRAPCASGPRGRRFKSCRPD